VSVFSGEVQFLAIMVATIGAFNAGFSLGPNASEGVFLTIEGTKKAPAWLALSRKRLLGRVDSV
jgi:hypothetical protein